MSRFRLFIAVAMPFEDIRQTFPKPTPEELLKYLALHAHLIRGCWVARSEIVHPKHSKSFFTRANGERLAAARNYLVSLRCGGQSSPFFDLSWPFYSLCVISTHPRQLWRLFHESPIHMAELMEYGRIAEEDARPMLEAVR